MADETNEERPQAMCVEVEQLEGAVWYLFELTPPCLFQEVLTTHFQVIRGGNRTQIIADNKAWQCITDLGNQLPIDAFLLQNYHYYELLVSRLRRARGHWEDLKRAPINHVPYEIARLWGELSEEQRLIVAISAEYTAKEIDAAVAAATADTCDDEAYEDWE